MICIRQAQPRDIKQIAKIKVNGWRSAYKGIIDDGFLNAMSIPTQIERVNNYSLDTLFVAEKDNQILGFCRIYDYNGPVYEDKEIDCEIREIYIEPNLKRMGIGRELFDSAKNYFRQKGKRKLYLGCLKENYSARKFYEKMGGILTGDGEITIGGKIYPAVGFVYDLNDIFACQAVAQKPTHVG